MAMDPSQLGGAGGMPSGPGMMTGQAPGGGMGAPPMMPPLPPPGKRKKRGGRPKVRHRKTIRGAKKRG